MSKDGPDTTSWIPGALNLQLEPPIVFILREKFRGFEWVVCGEQQTEFDCVHNRIGIIRDEHVDCPIEDIVVFNCYRDRNMNRVFDEI